MPKPFPQLRQHLLKKGIKPSEVIFPIDALLGRLGLISKPLVFFSWQLHVLVLTSIWLVGLPLIGLALQSAMGINNVLLGAFGEHFIFHLASSLIFGATLSYLIRRSFAKLKLPDWDQIEKDRSTTE